MKRGTRFAIGLAAAALTFGSLWAFVGPKRQVCGPFYHSYEQRWNHHHGDCHQGPWTGEGQEKAPEKAEKDSPTL